VDIPVSSDRGRFNESNGEPAMKVFTTEVQISADLANGQDREQSFAYLVQIQDGDGVTVSLAIGI
jgi:hypothetical protein